MVPHVQERMIMDLLKQIWQCPLDDASVNKCAT